MLNKRLICAFLLCVIAYCSPAQEKGAGTGPPAKSFKSERKLRKEERRQAREKRKQEKAERKAVKAYHKRLQTKKVRKRMKQSKKKAQLNNDNRREFFLKRWFSKKKKV